MADASPTDSRARQAGVKGQQTRQAVLRAAIQRFGHQGFRATSVADVAREAGVGGTVPYAYFASKDALFLAAADEDAAAVIEQVVPTALAARDPDWPQQMIGGALAALGSHPLARRILAGLEPEVTSRVLEVPALEELRKTVAEQLRSDQADARVRPDIDPVATANGVVTIILALIMSAAQIGPEAAAIYGGDVATVLRAAIEPHRSGPGPL